MILLVLVLLVVLWIVILVYYYIDIDFHGDFVGFAGFTRVTSSHIRSL